MECTYVFEFWVCCQYQCEEANLHWHGCAETYLADSLIRMTSSVLSDCQDINDIMTSELGQYYTLLGTLQVACFTCILVVK